MGFIKRKIIESKERRLAEEYPYLILSPRVPMEEELGINKEDVLEVYNRLILGELCDQLEELGFKRRGKTQDYYQCLDFGGLSS